MDKTVTLNNELTQSLNNLDKLRDLYKDGQVEWLVVVYQVGDEIYQRVWCHDVDVIRACAMQGALMDVRDHVSGLVAGDDNED